MRILNVTAQKPDSTGSGTYLAETVRCQLAAGHEAAVVCGIAAGDETPALPGEARVFPVRFDTPALPFHVVGMSDVMPYPATRYRDMTPDMVERFKQAFADMLARADAEFAPDLVVCHHLYLVTAVARNVLPHRRVVALSHSTDLRQLAKHDLERAFILRGVRGLDGVLALHEAQRDEICAVFDLPAERVRVVGTGYNDAVFCLPEGEGRGDRRGEDGVRRVLYVGKIARNKGVASLVGAFGALGEQVGAVELVLVGGHSDEAEYEEICALARACPRPVRLPGRLSPEDLLSAYRAADVFVLPSFFEGLPLVVVEALASGCKAVVTDLPGVRPWLAANAAGAPVAFVETPPMLDVDTPDPAGLPAFEERLARALEESLAAPWRPCDLSGATWRAVTSRIVG